MPQGMELTYVPTPVHEEPPQDDETKREKKRFKVRVSLYYDGTQNNRANTRIRKSVEQGQAVGVSNAEYLEALTLFDKYGMKGSSFDNDESNVSRLEAQSTETATGYDHYFRVYTEGIGTIDKGKDSLWGAALGAFETGIYAKVDKGIQKALSYISSEVPEGSIIEELALDTCGFSRGAAAARCAIHRAVEGEEKGPSSLKASLERLGFEVGQVKVLAVCLFDTVSSYGLRHSGNAKELKLDAIKKAKAVLQLAAAEEYRENFSLTTIESAEGKGRNVYLPGAHSDVGGCYEDDMIEEKDLHAGQSAPDVAHFLLERGWYTKQQLRNESVAVDIHATFIQKRVHVNRRHIKKEYSYISLHIMADFAEKQGLSFVNLQKKFQLRTAKENASDPEPIPAALVEEIKRYAQSTSDSKPTDWEMPRDDLNRLRNGYLHVPFSTDIGMGVNLAKAGWFFNRSYRPHRRVYRG